MHLLRLVFTFLLFIFAFVGESFSQEMSLKGHVYDSSGVRPIPNAVAIAVRVRDSLMLGYRRTDATGAFELNGFQVDTFTLIISSPGYDDKLYYIFGHAENDSINIPKIAMPSESQELEEVIIYANKNPIFYNGDTLVYVADSFSTAENAVVEDLLKRLPGLEIDKDGKIKSQGKEIDQVLVDGDEFFGSDPTIATRNLGASGVKTVQVYEKKQENAADGEETLQILDLRLKDEAKKGYFGRVSAASDFQQFYESELLFNKFNKSQKISVFVLGANTPKSNFGFGDRNKFGLENEGSTRMFNDDGDFVYSQDGETSGIPQTLRAGIYYSDKIGKNKKTEIGFNYSYYDSKNNAISKSRSQYFVQDSTFSTDDSTRNISTDVSHNINLRFETQIDSLTRLEIRPSFRLNTGEQESSDFTTWRTSEENFSRSNEVTNSNKAISNSLSAKVELNRKFMKPRRLIALNYDVAFEDNRSDGNLKSSNILTDSSQVQASYDQEKINYQNGNSHSLRASYYEPIGKKFKIQTEYSYDIGNTNQNKETRDYNPTTNLYDNVNTIYSNNFENLRTQHRAGLKLWYESKKFTITAGARVRNIVIDNRNKVTDANINQNFTNILPTALFVYNPTRSKRLRVSYNTNSKQPSITDLQPIPDNTNPNRLRSGNPNLRPDYSHSLQANFNTWNALTGRYIYVGGNGYYVKDAFGDSTSITAYGQQIITRVNVKNASSAGMWIGAGIPLKNRKYSFRPNLSGNIYQGISFLNGEKNTMTNLTVTPSLGFEYQADSLEVSVSADLNYVDPKNSLSSFTTTPYTTQDYYLGFVYRAKHGFKFQSNVNYTLNGQRSNGYNINYFIWNAEVSKTFLKTRNLELSFIANDILNQNINATRFVSQNIVTDNFTKIISRYFLVKLTLRFNSNKTTEEDGHGGWH
jgi:hypothetical protein